MTSLLLCFVVIAFCIAKPVLSHDKVVEIGEKRLHVLKNFHDQTVFYWRSDHQVSKVEVRLKRTQAKGILKKACQDVDVQVVFNHNAIPVPRELAASLPPNILTHNLSYHHQVNLTLPKDIQDLRHTISITNTSAAKHYFVSMFIKPKVASGIAFAEFFKVPCVVWGSVLVYTSNSTIRGSCAPEAEALITQQPEIEMKRVEYNLFHVLLVNEQNRVLPFTKTLVYKWFVKPTTDTGGSIRIELNTDAPSNQVFACLQHQDSYFNSSSTQCAGGYNVDLKHPRPWLAYPSTGYWFLTLRTSDTLRFDLKVSITTCPEDCFSRNGHGFCTNYNSSQGLFSVGCICKFGWKGIACHQSDGSTYLGHVAELVILVASNFAFIACTYLAVSRRFYLEAVVYTLVMTFSSLYHICDTRTDLAYCVLSYDVLQFADFLVSISSFWITAVAVSRIENVQVVSLLHVCGVFLIAILVANNRFSPNNFFIPIVLAHVVVGCSFYLKSKTPGERLPVKSILLTSLVPGMLCGFVGMCVYGLFSTDDNYFILHSTWHILVAIAGCILLPKENCNCKRGVTKVAR